MDQCRGVSEQMTNPKDLVGEKKVSLSIVPPAAILQIALALQVGAKKYGRANWRKYKVFNMIYVDAALRHLYAYADGEDADPETGISHLAHAAAGLSILLDAQSGGTCLETRTQTGYFGRDLRDIHEATE